MCLVCEHDRRSDIDQALRAGLGLVAIKRTLQLTVSLSDMVFHRDICVLAVSEWEPVARAYHQAERIEFFAHGDLDSIHDRDLIVAPAHVLDAAGARRVVCAVLLKAIEDARHGAAEAIQWVAGDEVRYLVGLLNSEIDECWPPTVDQIAGARTSRSGRG